MDNTLRYGRFNSSQNHRACGVKGVTVFKTYKSEKDFKEGKRSLKNFSIQNEASSFAKEKGLFMIEVLPEVADAFYTYAEEKASERFMGRSVDTKVTVRSMLWGKLMEVVLFNLLGLEYEMVHKQTLVHPKYDFWSGTPDLKTPIKVGEIKCYEPKKFAALSRCLLKKDVELLKSNFKEEYWQVVSNAIILGVDVAEIMAYMPYRSELLEIINEVQESNFLESNDLNPQDYFYWLNEDNIDSLPYLPDDSKASNINKFEFEVPKDDIVFLTERIIMANEEAEKLL